ncbi:hypothetical protein DL98DRAFT_530892 [Cadophora sp. DSE1049]|nr:hypothetical protein DL98DRAFT_530892 [Cadophora sp. DSE1049]
MIPEAIKLNPSLKPELRLFDDEINSSKAVVDLIRNQSGLHTSGVIAGIRMLQSHSEIVMDDLDCLDDKVREDLKGMIDNFRAKRKTLAQQIRLVSVGLTKSDGAFKIKTNIVKSTNTAVKKVLGNDSGLVIASFLAKLNRDLDCTSISPLDKIGQC